MSSVPHGITTILEKFLMQNNKKPVPLSVQAVGTFRGRAADYIIYPSPQGKGEKARK